MRNIYKAFLGGFCLFLMSDIGACKKFVTIPPPSTEAVTASVFNSDANATAAMIGIYLKMESNADLANLSYNIGMMSDELTNHSSSSTVVEYYTNSLLSKSIPNPWNNGYNYIYQANAVLSGLQSYTGVSSLAKQQLTGEAEFIRAFWLFYLVNCYGPIPLVTSTDYSINATATRVPTNDIYRQIITDLTDAENLLSPNYVDVTDSVITIDRVRPNKWAAAALLARAYLYHGVYDSAEQQSTIVINNPNNLYYLCQSLDSVFLMNNTEAIWQISPVQPNSNLATPEGRNFILYTAPGGGKAYNNATISSQLMNSFDSGDMRMNQWIGDFTSGGKSYYFPNKYKVYNTSSLVEYSVILRLAEQYLIRAEAEVQLGNTGGALVDLNIIRKRAGLGDYAGAKDQTSLLAAILHERQIELFGEIGHRWFDLNRTNNINSLMSVVTPLKGGSWSSNWAFFPIPIYDLTADPALIQNPGY